MSAEEMRRRMLEGQARYWANVTPEQLAERYQKGAETRARNKALQEERHRKEAAKEARRQRRNEAARLKREKAAEPVYVSRHTAGKEQPDLYEVVPPAKLAWRARTFWDYVDTSGGPHACWPWNGLWWYESDYGAASWRGKIQPAHRIAWMLRSGLEPPYETVMDHLCLCKWCVNPDHLEPTTRGENVRRIHHRPAEATRERTSWERPLGLEYRRWR